MSFNGRDYVAYTTPSAIIIGIGLHSLFSAAIMIVNVENKKTPVWRVSLLSFLLLTLFMGLQFHIVDFFTSPYLTPNGYFDYVFCAGYVTNILLTISIAALLLMRVKIFYSERKSLYYGMIALGMLVIMLKGLGDFLGIYVSYQTGVGMYASPFDHPYYSDIALVMAIATAFEAIFSALGSYLFISFLLSASHSDSAIDKVRMVKEEVISLTIIMISQLFMTVLAIWVKFDDNYISHVAFFMPSFVYALELKTFLALSYYSAKKIISAQKTSTRMPGVTYSTSDTEKRFPSAINQSQYSNAAAKQYSEFTSYNAPKSAAERWDPSKLEHVDSVKSSFDHQEKTFDSQNEQDEYDNSSAVATTIEQYPREVKPTALMMGLNGRNFGYGPGYMVGDREEAVERKISVSRPTSPTRTDSKKSNKFFPARPERPMSPLHE
ncbi:hypothetical protein HK103_006474 [Boothiomyces macroporosus]|uniref:Uncharacterized protein n=1 Tax=Boothiomyces macroporosus TaxID=261099 RepID=A0AAD5Y7X7_9FUNG|nr:hypothetical protein HK103_006474 [Boothiomyces macroporosus]